MRCLSAVDGESRGLVPDRSAGCGRVLRGPRPEAVPALVGRACTLVGLIDIAAGVFPRFRHSRMHTLAEVLPGRTRPVRRGALAERRRPAAAARPRPQAPQAPGLAGRRGPAAGRGGRAVRLPALAHRRPRLAGAARRCCCATASEFAALPDPRSRWRALANFVLMGAGSLGLGLVIVSAHPGRMVGDPSLADRLEHVLYGLFGFEGPVDYRRAHVLDGRLLPRRARPADRRHHHLPRLPPRAPGRAPHRGRRGTAARPAGQARRPRLARPLRAPPRQGASSSPPAARPPSRYRVVSGVMLASGDPIGDVEAWPGAIERFMDEAKAHSWTPAVMGCSRDRRRGLDPGDRPRRPGARRRGGGGRRGFLPHRARDAQRTPDGEAHRARRLRDPGTARP